MSLTTRDGRSVKDPQSDTSGTAGTDARGADDVKAKTTAHAAGDVLAQLCRMSLVRHEALNVNGAYRRDPPEIPDTV